MKMENKEFRGFDFNKVIKMMLIILPIGVIGNILFSWFSTDENIFETFKDFPLAYLAICLILCIVPWFTHSIRMMIWIRFLNYDVPFREVLKIAIATELGAGVSPTAMGGGPLKAGMLVQQKLKPGTAISLTVMGSLEDYTFFFLGVPFALFFSSSWKNTVLTEVMSKIDVQNVLFTVSGVLLFLIFIYLILRKNVWQLRTRFLNLKIVRKIRNALSQTINDFLQVYRLIGRRGKWLFVLTVLINAVHWLAKYSVVIVLLIGLGIQVNWLQLCLLQWVVFVCMLFIPTPGATIGAEASFFFIFQSVVPDSVIGIITPAWRFLTYYFQLSLGAIVFSCLNYSPVRKIQNFFLDKSLVEI